VSVTDQASHRTRADSLLLGPSCDENGRTGYVGLPPDWGEDRPGGRISPEYTSEDRK